jgi:chromatin assembly factor 1 subunit A
MSKVIIGAFNVPCLHATSAHTPTAAPAPAPIPLAPTTGSGSPVSALPPKPRPSGPKIAFPIPHLADLFALIHGNTQIKPVLVAQLHQQFEAVTTKAAIEAKVKEVALRAGRTKDSQWKVKHGAWVSCYQCTCIGHQLMGSLLLDSRHLRMRRSSNHLPLEIL